MCGMTSRGTTETGRRVRKTPAERRAEIVGCAIDIAMREGLEAITLRSVSTSLGVTGGLVGHYFPSVDDLLAEAFATVTMDELDELFTTAERESGARARLRSLLTQLLGDDRDPITLLLLDGWHAGRRRPALQAAVDTLMTGWLDRLAGMLRQGAEEGTWRVDDPEATATRILSVVDGLGIQAVMRGTIDYGPVRDLVTTVTERELGLRAGTLAMRQPPGR